MAHLEGLLEGLREANTGLSEVAFKLRRELTPKAPALKTAIKAERETFHLKGELQRLDMEDLEQATGRNSDHLAVESRRDLASCHGSIVRIACSTRSAGGTTTRRSAIHSALGRFKCHGHS